MLPVEAVVDQLVRIDLVHHPVSVVLGRRCEHDDLTTQLIQPLQKRDAPRTHVVVPFVAEDLCGRVLY